MFSTLCTALAPNVTNPGRETQVLPSPYLPLHLDLLDKDFVLPSDPLEHF